MLLGKAVEETAKVCKWVREPSEIEKNRQIKPIFPGCGWEVLTTDVNLF